MKESKGKRRTKLRIQPDWRWITSVFGATIGISAAMSLVSNGLLSGSGIAVSFLILMVIILLGIVFDIIRRGPVTAAEERPFHSMAAKKVRRRRRR